MIFLHLLNTQQKFKARMQNISIKSKSLSNLVRNLIHMPNILQPNSMTQILPQSTNVEEQLASSSDKATTSVQLKHLLPKTMPCELKRKSQFLKNPDPTHNVLSTLTTKSVVPVDADPISTGMQTRPPP